MTNLPICRNLQNAFALLILLVLTACASTSRPMQVRSNVDALAASSIPLSQGRNFVILPGDPNVGESDLQFIEFRSIVEKALLNRGFTKATSLDTSDLVLFMTYGVGAPEMVVDSYDVPLWTGMGYYGFGRGRYFYPGWGAGMGYAQRINTYSVYRRFLSVSACEVEPYRMQKQRVERWRVNVESRGLSNDLRLTFPYMVAAMQTHIATNTGHMLTIDVDESDPVLKTLQGSFMPQP